VTFEQEADSLSALARQGIAARPQFKKPAIVPASVRWPALTIGQTLRSGPDAALREAEELMHEALTEEPNNPLLTLELGDLYVRMRRFELAGNAYARTLSIVPSHAVAYARMGALMWHMGRAEDSLGFFECALNFDPNNAEALVNRLLIGARQADWHDPDLRADMVRRLKHSENAVAPGACLSLTDDPEFHAIRADLLADSLPRSAEDLTLRSGAPERLRVGYFGDIGNDREAFLSLASAHAAMGADVFVYDYGADRIDLVGRSLPDGVRLRPAAELTDEALVQWAREDELDVALDLEGQSPRARPGVFALRAAPMQVGGFSQTGTLGRDMLDYMLSDPDLITAEALRHQSEKCLSLRGGSTWWGQPALTNAPIPLRASLGLPAKAVVLAAPAPVSQITEDLFDSWMRILAAVPDAVLWLRLGAPDAQERLRDAARAKGVDPRRIIFGWIGAMPKQVGHIRAADLVMDSFARNDRAGAAQALRHGVPVVTRMGRSPTARSTGAALGEMGLSDLVCHSTEAYEARIIALASDRRARAQQAERVAVALRAGTAFDAEGFAAALDEALRRVVARKWSGYLPDHLNVAAEDTLHIAPRANGTGG